MKERENKREETESARKSRDRECQREPAEGL